MVLKGLTAVVALAAAAGLMSDPAMAQSKPVKIGVPREASLFVAASISR